MKTKFLLCVMALVGIAFASQAQSNVDERLWGTWELTSAEQTIFGDGENMSTTNLQLADLMASSDKGSYQELFLYLFFFDNSLGTCIAGNNPLNHTDINEKGTFHTSGNNLTITLNKATPVTYDLTYSIQGSELTVSYRFSDATNTSISYQYEIIFNQLTKE